MHMINYHLHHHQLYNYYTYHLWHTSLVCQYTQSSLYLMYPTNQSIDLSTSEGKLQFRLGVGLAKLGLFELSMRHVRLAATLWG